MKAIWNGKVIAESQDIVMVEGNAYFPMDSINSELLQPSDKTSICPWKGTANYFSITVDGRTNTDAAWHYREPEPRAIDIANRVAFWKGVTVEE